MFNSDYIAKGIKEHNPNWPEFLIIFFSGSGKTNSLLSLIIYQPNIDKISLYAKDS